MATQDSRQQEIRIQQLFSTMQAAERNKDVDPIAYKRARIAYHRAAEGEGWIAMEEASLLAEAEQTTSLWKTKYAALQGLRDTHQTNVDIVRGAETAQTSVGDDFKYAVGELRRLVARDQDEMVLTAREAYLRAAQYGPPSWALYVVDGLIVVLLIYGIYVMYSRFGVRWAATGALIAHQDSIMAQRSYMQYLRQQLS